MQTATKRWSLAKVFTENTSPVEGISFSDCGSSFVASVPGEDALYLFDVIQGLPRKTIHSKKYGLGIVRVTHAPSTVLTAAKIDGTIRYLSLHDNAYLRYFSGHERPPTALEMAPQDDTFISAASHDSVRLWDLRSSSASGFMQIKELGNPLLAYDPNGLVFAVSCISDSPQRRGGGSVSTNCIRLFDSRNYAHGPFAAFEIVDSVSWTAFSKSSTAHNVSGTNGAIKRKNPKNLNLENEIRSQDSNKWCAISFTGDGKDMIVTTSSILGEASPIYIIDAFDGTVKNTLITDESSSENLQDGQFPVISGASISPDGNSIYCCDVGGNICVWDRHSGLFSHTLEASQMSIVSFNPRYDLMLSAGSKSVALWLPDL